MYKNIDKNKIIDLKDQMLYLKGQVSSKTIAQNDRVSVTLFAFDEGEEISSHASNGDALVTILDGEALITVGEDKHLVKAGQTLIMPAKIPHALYAQTQFKMILHVVF